MLGGFTTAAAISNAAAESITVGDAFGAHSRIDPVLSILPYRDEDEAIRIANDTLYGRSGEVSSGDPERARRGW